MCQKVVSDKCELFLNKKRGFIQLGKSVLSEHERELISEFKMQWPNLGEVDPIDHYILLPNDDPAWWFRMQHYDPSDNGTRPLDVTSSIPAALLFASLDWETGLIDGSTDGVLYLFNEGMNAVILDFAASTAPNSDD